MIIRQIRVIGNLNFSKTIEQNEKAKSYVLVLIFNLFYKWNNSHILYKSLSSQLVSADSPMGFEYRINEFKNINHYITSFRYTIGNLMEKELSIYARQNFHVVKKVEKNVLPLI